MNLRGTNNVLIQLQFIRSSIHRDRLPRQGTNFRNTQLLNESGKNVSNVSNKSLQTCVKVINYLAVLTAAREKAIAVVYASLWTLSSLLDFEPLTHSPRRRFGDSARGCELRDGMTAENGQVTRDMQTYTVNQQKSARGTSNTDLTVAIGKHALKFVRKAEQDQPLRKSSGEILKMFLGF